MKESLTHRVGEANKRLILNAVRRRASISVEELVRETRRSQPTVLKWLTELERDGTIVRDGRGASTGGRPPALYRFDGERGHVLGISLEIPAARLILLNLRGEVRAEDGWRLDTSADPDGLLGEVELRARAFVHRHVPDAPGPVRAGVVLSGFIDEHRGVSLETPRLSRWRDVPVRDELVRRLAVPVALRHHIDALTLSEVCVGASREWRDFLYFDVGHGLGVRLVRDGRHVLGSFGNAGLIGHTTVVPDGRPCVCGNRGCLEEYVSGRALAAHARFGAAEEELELDGAGDLHATGERLFRSARAGDGEAHALVEEMSSYLAIGLANAINLFDVPRVILSGFVRGGGDAWRAALEEATRARLQATLARSTRIAFAQVPRSQAGAHGAGLFALREHLPHADPLVAPGVLPREEVSTAGATQPTA